MCQIIVLIPVELVEIEIEINLYRNETPFSSFICCAGDAREISRETRENILLFCGYYSFNNILVQQFPIVLFDSITHVC
jgi:hypothetical protein